MIKIRILLILVSFFTAAAAHAHEQCSCDTNPVAATTATNGKSPETATSNSDKPDAPKRHPLKGIVIDVLAAKSALLVKHEEIPEVMKAMTMLLKVDDTGIKAVKKGDPITAFLVRRTDGWWLEEVRLSGEQK